MSVSFLIEYLKEESSVSNLEDGNSLWLINGSSFTYLTFLAYVSPLALSMLLLIGYLQSSFFSSTSAKGEQDKALTPFLRITEITAVCTIYLTVKVRVLEQL